MDRITRERKSQQKADEQVYLKLQLAIAKIVSLLGSSCAASLDIRDDEWLRETVKSLDLCAKKYKHGS